MGGKCVGSADSAARVRVVVRYIGANSSREGITESKRVKVGEEESGKETIASEEKGARRWKVSSGEKRTYSAIGVRNGGRVCRRVVLIYRRYISRENKNKTREKKIKKERRKTIIFEKKIYLKEKKKRM